MAELEERLEAVANKENAEQPTLQEQFDMYGYAMYRNIRDRVMASCLCVPVTSALDRKVQQLIYAQTAKAVFDLFPGEVGALFIKKEIQHPRPVLRKGNGTWQSKTQ